MADQLSDEQLQVLSAVRDEGLPTNDVAVADRTGMRRAAVREVLQSLGREYLRVEPHHDGAVSDRIEVVAFLGTGGVPREPAPEAAPDSLRE